MTFNLPPGRFLVRGVWLILPWVSLREFVLLLPMNLKLIPLICIRIPIPFSLILTRKLILPLTPTFVFQVPRVFEEFGRIVIESLLLPQTKVEIWCIFFLLKGTNPPLVTLFLAIVICLLGRSQSRSCWVILQSLYWMSPCLYVRDGILFLLPR